MLTFDDEPAPALPATGPRTPETIRAQVLGGILSREPVHDIDVEKEAAPGELPSRAPRGQARHQRPGRRQPARAVQVPLGVGEVPCRLRQPLDAARDQHAARHRAVEEPQRPDRRRAPHRQAQPGLLRHRRLARRQQHRARHLSPHHGARVPAVSAAAGVRGGDPHARVPVHHGEPGPQRSRDLQRLPRDQVDPRQGRLPDPVHQHADRSHLQDRHARGRPAAPEEPDRLQLHHGGPLLLRRLRADPGHGPPEQDDRRVRAVPVHPARRVDALLRSASISSTPSSSRIRIFGPTSSRPRSPS